MLSETDRLAKFVAAKRKTGFFDRLRKGEDFIPLGLVVEGGQGLATADDRRFLGVVDGTPEAAAAAVHGHRLISLLDDHPTAKAVYEDAITAGGQAVDGLLAVNGRYVAKDVGWPRIGLIRTVSGEEVRRRALSDEERERGITEGPTWVPFEKGDTSAEGGGGSAWSRRNVLVIDWSPESVNVLRERARRKGSRSPRLQNERLWGQGGVTWNRAASYLRVRIVPPGAIFSDMAPTIRPTVDWLTVPALLALLNAPAADFILRTFVGSRMHVEVGDMRRVPVPVPIDQVATELDRLGSAAVAAHESGPDARADLKQIERTIDILVRDLYGFAEHEEFWVVR
jgi:hypothetical protein